MGVLDGLKPERVFYYFEEISSIPHGSFDTGRLSDYLIDFAKKKNLEAKKDELGNVIIIKQAAKGCENADTVMLQGHIDMVCEKNQDSVHDFKKDPLRLRVMDEYVYAAGTTLGGDDGIAAAYMLALLEDEELIAPRLECVFTVDEEVGMLGAAGLDTGSLKAKYLLNIDSEEEGVFLTSCAGGVRGKLILPVEYENREGIRYKLVVCGLKGGHSGTEIDKYLANANILMGRLLYLLSLKFDFSIMAISGGMQDNAIPREAGCEIVFNDGFDENGFEDYIASFQDTVSSEYRFMEKNIQVYCVRMDETKGEVLTKDSADKLIFLLNFIPNGVQKMSHEIDGLVQTSLNLGIMRLKDGTFSAISAIRSSLISEKLALSEKLRFLSAKLSGEYEEKGDYPAWEYREDSKLRNVISECFTNLYGRNASFSGIHAGLECGIFASKIPGIDIVSFGPDILDIHSPKERMNIPSAERVYNFIKEVLKKLSE